MHKDSKKNQIKILELFSGIGGFSKGFLDADYKFSEHYFSEVDKYAIANYKYNFKNSIYVGDVRKINGNKFKGIDVITFGSPCQDFSIAGKRTGLEGDRSSLIREAIRIVAEARPRIFIWENVKGTFSSNARKDFWAILQAFTNIRGYRFEWQLLNTKWFLPQNRERIYFIGFSTKTRGSKFGIFPFTENDFIPYCKVNSKKRQIQATNHSTTINPQNGSRASDTFIQIGDFRYDTGFRLRKNGNSPTLRAKEWDTPILKIKNNCKRGYKPAQLGDSIGYSYYKSNNKRGRVGKAIAQTIDTTCTQGVLLGKCKIRKLTEIECERLQGFPDNWTRYGIMDSKQVEISKTQRYKMLGNAVTVKVVEEIAKRLKKIL